MGKRYYKKYYYKKGKWSPNIYTIGSSGLVAQTGNFYISQELAKNPVQTTTTISQSYTVKNVELNFELAGDSQQNISGVVVYIMYAPQGITVNSSYANNHPEYIMAYRFLGKPNYLTTTSQNPGRNSIKVKSRLSRKLQTGDSIVLLIVGENTGNQGTAMQLSGVFRWWTKAN